MKFKIKIYIQSFSDIITNSSSELFCVVRGKWLFMKEVEEYLNSIGLNVELDEWDERDTDIGQISFDAPYGALCDGNLVEYFIPLLKKVLSDKFGDENYEIDTDVSY